MAVFVGVLTLLPAALHDDGFSGFTSCAVPCESSSYLCICTYTHAVHINRYINVYVCICIYYTYSYLHSYMQPYTCTLLVVVVVVLNDPPVS